MLVYYLCYYAGQKSSTSIKHRQILYRKPLVAWCSMLARMPALYILFIEHKQHYSTGNQVLIPCFAVIFSLSVMIDRLFSLALQSKKQVSSIFVRPSLSIASTAIYEQLAYSVCSHAALFVLCVATQPHQLPYSANRSHSISLDKGLCHMVGNLAHLSG